MNKNVVKTKKQLTIMFTIIVSLLVIILWVSFFSLKYFKELTIEKRILWDMWRGIESGRVIADNFSRFSKDIWKNILRKQMLEERENNTAPFSYVLYDDDRIISYNIKEKISEDFLQEIIDAKNYDKVFQLGWFLVRKVEKNNNSLIVFKQLRYNFSSYVSDIIIFVFVTLIFSWLLYYVWNKFVNKVFIPVEENLKDMNHFIHNAGHELKTPLSVIDSNIQLTKDIKKYDEEMLDEMKSETKKLNSLIDSLIHLSDIWNLKTQIDTVQLRDIIDQIIATNKKKIKHKDISVKVDVAKNIMIQSNRNYLYIVLSNIITNAIKYNKKHGHILIEFDNNRLTIEDSGIGIHKKDTLKIFDRFFQVDSSRGSDGFWIWLSLVKKIVDMYWWNIHVKSTQGKSTCFIIDFI